MAIICINQKITEEDSFFISSSREYNNWKTRKVLGVRTDHSDNWFYTVHMGWWEDEEDPFSAQWERFDISLHEKKDETAVWLMGDFNSPDSIRNQGYDCIRNSGWMDTYLYAKEKDAGITVEGVIDGWRTTDSSRNATDGMRIDYIWCSRAVPIKASRVMFNEKNGPRVSDHFGVLVETMDS